MFQSRQGATALLSSRHEMHFIYKTKWINYVLSCDLKMQQLKQVSLMKVKIYKNNQVLLSMKSNVKNYTNFL